jgi:hypothetical protein
MPDFNFDAEPIGNSAPTGVAAICRRCLLQSIHPQAAGSAFALFMRAQSAAFAREIS